MNNEADFFSIRSDLIRVDLPLSYDLFINSSTIEGREKFVKIISRKEILTKHDIEQFQKKYIRLYVPESQRKNYLQSFINSHVSDIEKTEVIKETALDYLHKIFDDKKSFSTEVLAKNINACREVVESMIDVLDNHNIDSLRSLIGHLSFHDFYTYDHSINVSMYCIQIYKAFKPTAKRQELMHAGLGGLLHDLGKIKIPTNVLNKPEGLNRDEYELIKHHPDLGLGLLLNGLPDISEDIDLKTIARVIHEHHENFDGTGYPRKLKGKEEIHLLARICMIADFFDAITTKRSYNSVLNLQDAMKLMAKTKCQKLDPDLFDVFEKQVHYIRSDYQKDLTLSDDFDPSIPFKKLPLHEKQQEKKTFGKVKVK